MYRVEKGTAPSWSHRTYFWLVIRQDGFVISAWPRRREAAADCERRNTEAQR